MWCFIVSEVKSIRSRVRNNVGDWKKIIFFMNIFRTGHLAAKKCLLPFKISRIKGTRALRSPGAWRLIGTSRDCAYAYNRVGYFSTTSDQGQCFSFLLVYESTKSLSSLACSMYCARVCQYRQCSKQYCIIHKYCLNTVYHKGLPDFRNLG